jgi:ABC-2 type transport system permease protein
VLGALYDVMLRTLVTRGRLAVLGSLGGLAVLLAALIGAGDDFDRVEEGARFVNLFGLSLLTPIVALVFAAASLGDPSEDSTLVYLWLRPVPRSRIVLAALAATLTVAAPLTVVPLVVAAALASGDQGVVVGTALAATVAVTAYASLFVWLGLRVRRALVWGLAYILIWEGFVANAGDNAAKLAVRAYSRSILAGIGDVDLRLGEISLGAAVVVPLVVAVAAAMLAIRRLARQDVA